MSDGVVRLPSSIGIGRCLDCGTPCEAGYSHFPPDAGMCHDCAVKLLSSEQHEALQRRAAMRVVRAAAMSASSHPEPPNE